jgi:hypothetical protein
VRVWPSIDVGTEVYVSSKPYVAEWTVSDFDVLITSSGEEGASALDQYI